MSVRVFHDIFNVNKMIRAGNISKREFIEFITNNTIKITILCVFYCKLVIKTKICR